MFYRMLVWLNFPLAIIRLFTGIVGQKIKKVCILTDNANLGENAFQNFVTPFILWSKTKINFTYAT